MAKLRAATLALQGPASNGSAAQCAERSLLLLQDFLLASQVRHGRSLWADLCRLWVHAAGALLRCSPWSSAKLMSNLHWLCVESQAICIPLGACCIAASLILNLKCQT